MADKMPLEAPKSASSDSNIEVVAQSDVNEKSLLRKLDLRLLPPVSILYLLSFLDRSNGLYNHPYWNHFLTVY